jgi:lysyl-tRNA synthetase class 2
MNPSVKRSLPDVFRLRAALRRAVREYFDSRGYLEVETPCLVRAPGTEVYLNYFPTAWESLGGDREPLYLRSSPELHMKQALAAGCPRIYQIGPCFRNRGELGPWHHPEFSMLEWYHCGTGYEEFMEDTAGLLRHCANAMTSAGCDALKVPSAIPRFTLSDAFSKFAGVDLVDMDPGLAVRAKKSGVVSVRDGDDFDTAFFKILLEKVEPALKQYPVAILHDYPASQAALAVVSGGVARRFEFFVNGVELSNAFLELPGRAANEARIRESAKKRAAAGLPPVPEDIDFLDAMAVELPPCAGNALGMDRLLAVLAGEPGIAGLVPFRNSSVWRDHLP